MRDQVVLIAGATSAAGNALTRALATAGARVVAVGSNQERLAEFASAHPSARVEQADLTDPAAVASLAERVGAIDGLVHLVGGWRGGGGIAGQSDDDFAFLERSFTALRLVSRQFWPSLTASDAGRVAMVSSTALERPLAGGANYAAVKAASEAWMRALAHGFTQATRPEPPRGASVIFRVTALAGLEKTLADEVVALWAGEAAALNDTVRTLPSPSHLQ